MSPLFRPGFLRHRSSRPLALLLSAAAHLGLVCALGESAASGAAPGKPESRMVVVVTLGKPTAAIGADPPAPADARASGGTMDASGPAPGEQVLSATEDPRHPLTQAMPPKHEQTPVLPLLPVPEPRYFLPDELTEKPILLQDIPPDKIAALPDASPRPSVVQLLINEEGGIDKVIVEDASLSGQARQFIADSFADVKFRPGKLADMPVRSRLRIEVTLKSVTPAAVSVAR